MKNIHLHMAIRVRETIHDLTNSNFDPDVLLPKNVSLATSRASSIYKRHGKISEESLFYALESNGYKVKRGFKAAYGKKGKKYEIDIVVYDSARKVINIIEVKRGLGAHDTDGHRGMIKRLRAAKKAQAEIRTALGIPLSDTPGISLCVLGYYGNKSDSVAKGIKNIDMEFIASTFGSKITQFVSEVDDYFRFKIKPLHI